MGIKEKMMDGMLSKMSAEEKKEMMMQMMEKFFGGMTEEEKGALMKDVMPAMMKNMMGGSGSMMDMMGGGSSCNGENEGAGPMDMCKEMMLSIKQSKEISAIVTPEINTMFEEWVGQVNEEILNLLKNKKNLSIEGIAEHLKVSPENAIYFVSKLAQSGKVGIDVKMSNN